jgi:hypothetical protein
VYDFRELPLLTAARLACGLSADSRAWRKIRGEQLKFGERLAVLAFDVLTQIRFYAARGAGYKAAFPKALHTELTGAKPENSTDGFDSAEDFERMRARILKDTGGDIHHG